MSPTFFTDRDLGKRFPEILRASGFAVERHGDHFDHDCPDEVWLKTVGERGWTAVTHDGRIRYKPNELAAVVQHHVGLLVVIGNAPYPQLAQAFVSTRSRIQQFVESQPRPYIAKVYRPSASEAALDPATQGRIERWYPVNG